MFETLWKALGLSSESAAMPPVIGISGGNSDSASVRAMITQIQSAGAVPIFLGNHGARDAKTDIEKIDALVVMGNNADIDPERYGQQKHARTKPESATQDGKARADYEYALMQQAITRKMPFLGVCGGMQRLNVIMGGDLEQHIADRTGNDAHMQSDAPFTPVQAVAIAPGSTLADISRGVSAVYTPTHSNVPLAAIMENSLHHQAVNKIGNGLRLAAYAQEPDKNGNTITIPEAIEADPNGKFGGQFMLGVQWHPEFSASPLGKFIAERVVGEAKNFAKANGTARPDPLSTAASENKFSSAKPAATVMTPGPLAAQVLANRNQTAGMQGLSAV